MGSSSYSFWVGKELKKLKRRTLTGPGKLIVFRNIKIAGILGDTEELSAIQGLSSWLSIAAFRQGLSKIQVMLTSRFAVSRSTHCKNRLRRSQRHQFITNYLAKYVTLYMHCMVHHISEFMSLHGSILSFLWRPGGCCSVARNRMSHKTMILRVHMNTRTCVIGTKI